MAIFILVTEISKKDEVVLDRVLYIYYLFRFYKNKKNEMQALINFNNKVNAITPVYALKLDLKICYTNIRA